jgi:hypothetical protein
MATNTIQIKRTSVSGRAANSSTLTNPGELALNMTDGIMYSTNGTSVFEIGANNTNQRVSGILTVNAISANGGVGTNGQFLTSNGSTVYWSTPGTALNAQQNIFTYTLAANASVIQGADNAAQTLSYTAGLESVFINGSRQILGVDYATTNSTAITLVDPALTGEVVQIVTWAGQVNTTNVNAQFAWTNTHSFSNTVTFAANVNFDSGLLFVDGTNNKVGIGTTSPGYALDVVAGDTTASLGYGMRLRSNATAAAAAFQFTNSPVTVQNGLIACTDTGVLTLQGDSATAALAFRTNGEERFKINASGGITSWQAADAVGYKGLPQNQQTSAYTLVLADMGKHIYATAANFNITIPANSTTAFPIGAAITIVVEDQFHTLVPAAGVTLVLAGTGAGTTGTRTLAQGAVATILKVGTDRWYVSGAGVT